MKAYTPKDWLKSNLVTAKKLKELEDKINEGGSVTVDYELDLTSENPVQNKVIAGALDAIEDSIDDIEEEIDNFSETANFNFTGSMNESTHEIEINADGFSVDEIVSAYETKQVKATLDMSAILGSDIAATSPLSLVIKNYGETSPGIVVGNYVVFGGTAISFDDDRKAQPTCIVGMSVYIGGATEPTDVWKLVTELELGNIETTVTQLVQSVTNINSNAVFIAGDYVITYDSNAGTCGVVVADKDSERMRQLASDLVFVSRTRNNMVRIRVSDTHTGKSYLIYNTEVEASVLPDDGWEMVYTFTLGTSSVKFRMQDNSLMLMPTVTIVA